MSKALRTAHQLIAIVAVDQALNGNNGMFANALGVGGEGASDGVGSGGARILSHEHVAGALSVSAGVRAAEDFIEDLFAVRIPKLIVFFVILTFGLIVTRVVPMFVDEILRRFSAPRHYRAVVSYLLHIGLFIGALWLSLAAIGVDFLGIIVGFGVVAIVISVGLSGPISNVFGGIILQINDNVQPGSLISINGLSGTVLEMNLFKVVLRRTDDVDDFEFIPNAQFMSSSVRRHVGGMAKDDVNMRTRLTAAMLNSTKEE
jgi:hypothetical protein